MFRQPGKTKICLLSLRLGYVQTSTKFLIEWEIYTNYYIFLSAVCSFYSFFTCQIFRLPLLLLLLLLRSVDWLAGLLLCLLEPDLRGNIQLIARTIFFSPILLKFNLNSLCNMFNGFVFLVAIFFLECVCEWTLCVGNQKQIICWVNIICPSKMCTRIIPHI